MAEKGFELYPATSFVPKKRGQGGRPSIYADDIANRICNLLIEGESLRSICAMAGMPGARTVFQWLATKPEFAQQYASAREAQAELMADDIVPISDEEEDPQRAKVRIDARKWMAGKLKPKKYGDKADDGDGGGNIVIQFNQLIQGVL